MFHSCFVPFSICCDDFGVLGFIFQDFRISDFRFQISDFGFRISRFFAFSFKRLVFARINYFEFFAYFFDKNVVYVRMPRYCDFFRVLGIDEYAMSPALPIKDAIVIGEIP